MRKVFRIIRALPVLGINGKTEYLLCFLNNIKGLVRVSSLKSRLGANSEPKRTVGVKSRLGEVRHSLRKPSADRSERYVI